MREGRRYTLGDMGIGRPMKIPRSAMSSRGLYCGLYLLPSPTTPPHTPPSLSHTHTHTPSLLRGYFEVHCEVEYERKEHASGTDRCVVSPTATLGTQFFFIPAHPLDTVLKHVLCRYPPEVLAKFEGIQQTVEGLVPYTERHFQRLSRLQQVCGSGDWEGEGRVWGEGEGLLGSMQEWKWCCHLCILQLATFVDYTWQRMRICSEVSAVPDEAHHFNGESQPQACYCQSKGEGCGQVQKKRNHGIRQGGGGSLK